MCELFAKSPHTYTKSSLAPLLALFLISDLVRTVISSLSLSSLSLVVIDDTAYGTPFSYSIVLIVVIMPPCPIVTRVIKTLHYFPNNVLTH